MITDYEFYKTDSPDAEQIIKCLDEMHFDIHAKGKSSRDKHLIKNYYNKKAIIASGLKTIYFSENPNKLCDRLKIMLQEKQPAKNSNPSIEEILAIMIEY